MCNDRYLFRLPPDAMIAVAADLRKLAAELIEAARLAEERAHVRDRVRRTRTLRNTLARQIAKDLAFGRPVAWDEKKLRLKPQAEKLARSISREIRNARIMQRYREGYSNAEIAAEFELHPKSISRIIGAQRTTPRGLLPPGPAETQPEVWIAGQTIPWPSRPVACQPPRSAARSRQC